MISFSAMSDSTRLFKSELYLRFEMYFMMSSTWR